MTSMTEAEKIALAMVNELMPAGPDAQGLSDAPHGTLRLALVRAIEAHEAFKREVSEAITELRLRPKELERFIIKPPVDPLVEAVTEWLGLEYEDDSNLSSLRQALATRGLQIAEIGQ